MATGDAAVLQGNPAGLPQPGGLGCGPVSATITNVKAVPDIIRYPSGPNWEVSGRGPGTLSLSKSVSVANSFNGSVTTSDITPTKISASVGFSVTKTYTTATAFTVNVPKGVTEVLRANTVYSAKTFRWKTVYACNTGKKKTRTGSGEAFRFLRLQYQAHRI